MGGRLLTAVVSAVALLSAPPARAQMLGDYLDAPVFFELFADRYIATGDLKLLRSGQFRVLHYPPVLASDFSWGSPEAHDYTWWIQAEELRFVLPLIASDAPSDRDMARDWIRGWLEAHEGGREPNPGAWKEPMSVAYRGMVLVYFLKREALIGNPDPELNERVMIAVFDHAEYLATPGNFDSTSNHGIVEAFALIELTRVVESTGDRELGTRRLLSQVERSVSPLGFHREHSPHYHFTVARWVDEFAAYLETLDWIAPEVAGTLIACRDRMLEASWFLMRHDGEMPQIGDTDSLNVSDVFPGIEARPGPSPCVHDAVAGYAIYKGKTRRDRRYAVFAIQNERPALISHYHNDCLSLYFADDSETILGDSGKYEYAWTPERSYFKSPHAHNRIFRAVDIDRVRNAYELDVADSTWAYANEREARMGGTMQILLNEVERTVELPARGPLLRVSDRVRPPSRNLTTLAMTWNAGRDVRAVRQVDTPADDTVEYRLEMRSGRRFRLRIAVSGKGRVEHRLVTGQDEPLLGWYSPRHRVMRPSPVVLITLAPRGTMTVTTELDAVPPDVPFLSGLTILLRGY